MTDPIEALYEHREALLIDLAASLKREDALIKQLAESQAREVVMRDALNDVLANATVHFPEHMIWPIESALAMTSDSTALDAMLKHAKREALLEAADKAESRAFGVNADWLRRMAKELE
jgi:hypothetical protein